jgi:hypothetical protein
VKSKFSLVRAVFGYFALPIFNRSFSVNASSVRNDSFFFITKKNAGFRPFVFLHLHTLPQRVIRQTSLFQPLADPGKKTGGRRCASADFRILLASDTIPRRGWLPFQTTYCAFGLAQSPDCAFHIDEVLA